ncbi:chloride channel protein [Collinsella bouchesdurhonensis]|uniref:chloride channel protein n=1 Tax=Collinsella bouchesdurhonensis TaxID=1907654 RepID=UPI00096A7D68|nr:chloride channel protein [Collinsella bouchesdurhonensis]
MAKTNIGHRLKHATRTYGGLLIMGAVAIPIGLIVGAIDAVFGRTLLAIGSFRDAHLALLLPFLALAGLAIVFCYKKWGKNTGRGMSLVFDVGHGREESISLRLVPLIMGGTWATHLFGGSAGREGVAVQIGATVSHWIGRKLPFKHPGNTFLLIGMAAGFAGLFRTPLAATVFALEVLVAGRLEYRALFPALIASLVASATSGALGLEKFEVALTATVSLDATGIARLAILGVVFGIVGGAFAWCLAHAKTLAGRLALNPYIRIGVIGAALSILLFALWQGRYCGLGTNLISAAFANSATIYSWDWIAKFILTIVTLAAGYQGGEVTPLFSIGASLGVAISGLAGIDPLLCAALGYAATFGGATNTLLAPIFIGCEVFGFSHLPAFFIVCAVAYLFNMDKSIYTLQERA